MRPADVKTPLGRGKGVSMKKMSRSKRIAALFGVFLLVMLYLVTLLSAFLDFEGSGRLFQACLVATVGVPILLWIYLWLFDKIRKER